MLQPKKPIIRMAYLTDSEDGSTTNIIHNFSTRTATVAASYQVIEIQATAHTGSATDYVLITGGGEVGELLPIRTLSTNFIYCDASSAVPSATDAFIVLTVESSSTVGSAVSTTTWSMSAHGASSGWYVLFTAGGQADEVRLITSITDSANFVCEAFSAAPSATDAFTLLSPSAADAVVASRFGTLIEVTAHAARVNDTFEALTGGEDGETGDVLAVPTANFVMVDNMSAAMSATDTLSIDGSRDFTLAPGDGEVLLVTALNIVYSDTKEGANAAYFGGGPELTNGMTLSVTQDGSVVTQLFPNDAIKNNEHFSDMCSNDNGRHFEVAIDKQIWHYNLDLLSEFGHGIRLHDIGSDKLVLNVSDDLSGLLRFKVSCKYIIEGEEK